MTCSGTISCLTCSDNLAEWSKALDLGSSPKGREFKSHSCQENTIFAIPRRAESNG